MSLLLQLNQYNIQDVVFLEPTRNKIIQHSNFIKILYSNTLFTMNGIYIYFPLPFHNIQPIQQNKWKYYFNYNQNKTLIKRIQKIESNLLHKVQSTKTPRYICYEQLRSGNFVTNNRVNNPHFILKISGIWETEYTYGLSFKFLNIN